MHSYCNQIGTIDQSCVWKPNAQADNNTDNFPQDLTISEGRILSPVAISTVTVTINEPGYHRELTLYIVALMITCLRQPHTCTCMYGSLAIIMFLKWNAVNYRIYKDPLRKPSTPASVAFHSSYTHCAPSWLCWSGNELDISCKSTSSLRLCPWANECPYSFCPVHALVHESILVCLCASLCLSI